MKLSNSEIESQIIKHFQNHITKYEDAVFWVNNTSGVNMRTLWNTIRRHFYGLPIKEKDRFGQYNIFYPITEFMTWENMKNIDVDTKDINIKARSPKDIGKAESLRYIIKDWMYQVQFGKQLNAWLLPFVLDGHLIVKKRFVYDPKRKRRYLHVDPVDIRNTFFDPHGKGIQNDTFVERSIADTSTIKRVHKNWLNLDKLKGRRDIPAIYNEARESEAPKPETELFEMWGQMPEYWFTGNSEDKDWVEGQAVVSNPQDEPIVHLLKRNTAAGGVKPYEEALFERAPGRAIGRGIGEKVLYLQIYLNLVYNARRHNNLLSHNQLFQYKKQAGLRPEDVRNLVTGGAIGVEQVGDIARIDTRDFDFEKSLKEEENLIGIANRLTSTQEPASGENLPASMPATNAIIQQQSVRSSHAQRQEEFGLFLSGLFSRQLLPDILKLYTKGDLLRITDDSEKINELKKKAAEYYAYKEAEDLISKGFYPSAEQLEIMKEQAMEKVENKKELYVQMDKNNPIDCDIEFFVTGESIDKNALVQNLQQILFNYQQFAQDPNSQKVLREIYDILGLDSKNLLPSSNEQQQVPLQPVYPGQQRQNPQGVQGGQAVNQSDIINRQIANVSRGQ